MMSTTPIERDGKRQTLVCVHWRLFPPPGADSIDPVKAFQAKVISPTEYQRLQVWQRICGLLKMKSDKCQTCEHARILETAIQGQPPMYVTLDGTRMTPALDIHTMSLQPTHRENLETMNRPAGTLGAPKAAAWLVHAQEEDD